MSLWILVILVVVILVLWWALRRNAQATKEVSQKASEGNDVAPVTEEVEVKATLVTDDLTVIEGIGPKIASVLKEAGITTFAQLAKEKPEDLKSILEKADLRLADPTTWPEQARLAAEGNEEGLKVLQEQLKGGRVAK